MLITINISAIEGVTESPCWPTNIFECRLDDRVVGVTSVRTNLIDTANSGDRD